MNTRTMDVSRANQNMGLTDRILRVVIGFAILGGGSAYVMTGGGLFTSAIETAVLVLMLVSIYPILTGILGVCPIYSLMGVRTCSTSGKNACGTFPYQVKAATGNAPEHCEPNDQHSLEGCHDDSEPLPKHEHWRVEQTPMLSPSEDDMEKFAAREKRLNL